jgi:hypothetical protein
VREREKRREKEIKKRNPSFSEGVAFVFTTLHVAAQITELGKMYSSFLFR